MRKPSRGDIRSDRAGCCKRFTTGAGLLHQLRSRSNRRSPHLALAAFMVTAACGASAQISIPASGIVNTVAGAGDYAGDGGPATSARINSPASLALDSSGNMYIADTYNNCVRKVTVSTGLITTIAGVAAGGYSGNGGAATSARLEQPGAVALDAAGNVYIADSGNNAIRKVTVATGIITTIAGNGTAGYSGDGGAATSAELNDPNGVAVDSSGNVYIADTYNQRVRKLTATTGKISTAAGNGTSGYAGDSGSATSAELSSPWGVAVDSSGNIYIADSTNYRVRKVTASSGVITTVAGDGNFGYSGDGGPAISAEFYFPLAVSIDSAGNLYIADEGNRRIRKVTASSGVITTLAGNGNNAYSGDSGPATSAALSNPTGVSVDASSNIYIADNSNNRIRKVTVSTGVINTVAGGTSYGGDGKAATAALLLYPGGIRVDASGNLYIADDNSSIRKVAASTGIITTVAGNQTYGYSGDGGAATSAQLNGPYDVALDSAGNLYIADTANERIRKVTVATGVITTVAGNGTAGYSGDGGAATSATLDGPTGLAVDSAGNIYIVDDDNDAIRKVTASTGVITTVAGNGSTGYSGDGGPATMASLDAPWYVALDAAGNLYFSEAGNNVIREVVAASGVIKTVVGTGVAGYSGDGGAATSATLNAPNGIGFDHGGNLYIADYFNNVIRKVRLSTTGVITTVAGTGTVGFYGDGMAAVSAQIFGPYGVAVDASGNLYFADASNDRIRVVGKVIPTAPVLSWSTPATIGYGTALSATQLDAKASVAGTFTYTPSAGQILPLGSNTLSVSFAPVDSVDYTTATAKTTIAVIQGVPKITWATPAAITVGTPLSATQFNAKANTPGTFVYSPAVGTVLTLGPHLLSVTFTPTNTIDYTAATETVAITVSAATAIYDTGTVSFVSGTTKLATVSYGENSTAATIASALAAAVNAASGTPVKLIALDDALYMTAVTPGLGGDSISYSISNTSYNTTNFSAASFPSATISGNLDGGAASGTDAGNVVYSYSDSYDHVGNEVGSNDSVMGRWTFTPDTLNRLSTATNVPVPVLSSATSYYCWSYDSFGNRTLQAVSSAAFASGPPACTPASGASYQGAWAHVSTANNNRFSNTQQAMGGVIYDGAGNILNDGVNQYLYDGDGRICAVQSEGVGTTVLTGYIYNAQGQRVGKGTITAWSCDPTVNGYQAMSDYILGPTGEQVTEMGMNGSSGMAWQHTNVYALGQLLATYDHDGLHFYLNDPLGTRRAQTDYAGVLEQTCVSLPFGDALNCTNSIQFPTEHHFTGKERDAESGNDYFGARYYGSSMGRFMSPDWSPRPASIPFADPTNPQSLNLYAYVNDNPLSHVDKDGHLWEELRNLWNWGHYVNNAGLNAALQNGADQARSSLSGMKGFTLNGQSPSDFAKGANNQQAIRAEQTVVDFLSGKLMQSLMGGSNDPRIQVGIVFPMDFPTSSTVSWSATFQSEGEARAFARTQLGADAVEVEPGKWRSADGKWQYRAKPGDVMDNHIHLEELRPNGEVKQNLHLRWPEGTEQ